MADFDEKSGTVDFHAKDYTWTQTIEEVSVSVPVPITTRGRDLEVVIKNNLLLVKFKNAAKPILDGEPYGTVKAKESIWTLEDRDKDTKEVRILLQKSISHESWKGLLKGEAIDAFTADQMDRKMMLEKFQKDYPGFDFSGANFTGQVPNDPKNWLQDVGEKDN
jgi:hypothetical protein